MIATVADIIKVMESFAPSYLTEKWDNSGLQVGKTDWPVRSIQVALDSSTDVLAAACEKNIDLLITHHPLIFKPLSSVDLDSHAGNILFMALKHKISIFTAHTNLDNAAGGLNDIFASKIGLRNVSVLVNSKDPKIYKIVVYAPVEFENKILNTIFETKAGKIGEYTCCSFRNKGKGTFKPSAAAKPFIGKANEISESDEFRIEMTVEKNSIESVINHIRKNHPYETMAYDVYPVMATEAKHGIGRIGDLDKKSDLASFAMDIKKKLKLSFVKFAGKPNLPINKAVVCTGSGSGQIENFFSSGADVFISGDLKYHDARAVEEAGVGLIDVGHFASEHLIVEVLAETLQNHFIEIGVDVNVEACKIEKDPFINL